MGLKSSSSLFIKLSIGVAAACLIIVVAVAGVLPQPAGAATPTKFLRSPYVQNVTADSAVISWEVDAAHSGTVSYGTSASLASREATTKESRSQYVSLTGLQPYSRYSFEVRIDGADLTEGGSFQTLASSAQQDIDFVAWGDHRTNYSAHRELALAVKSADPDLVIDVGDLVDTGTVIGDWAKFFSAQRELLASTSVFPVLGNHELDSDFFFDFFNLPGNERWYSFDSGPVHFTALDVVFSSFEPGSEQYDWLEQDLKNASLPWKVVWMHFPAYDYSPQHGANPAIIRNLAPLFEKYGVNLVFSGHSHLYSRNVVNGVNYIITGGGGAPLHLVGKGAATAYAESVYHYVKVAASASQLTITPTRLDGSEFDNFSLTMPADADASLVSSLTTGAASTAASGAFESRPMPVISIYEGGLGVSLGSAKLIVTRGTIEQLLAESTRPGPFAWASLVLVVSATTSVLWSLNKKRTSGR